MFLCNDSVVEVEWYQIVMQEMVDNQAEIIYVHSKLDSQLILHLVYKRPSIIEVESHVLAYMDLICYDNVHCGRWLSLRVGAGFC